jgi:16S rRNA (uracil1498-N3)-methyltransferase
MHRFYCPAKNISSRSITLSDLNQIHHIRDVLRLKVGGELIIFDERQNEYLASFEKIQAQKIILKRKTKIKPGDSKNRLRISVACAIPKKAKMDDMVDKLTQLGADRIIPLETERVIVKITGQKRNARIERWRRIALSASMQSQRKELPAIESIKTMDELLAGASIYDLKLIPTLGGERNSLKEILKDTKPANVLLLIGPEGDFSEKEVSLARNYGCVPVSLGNLVLRVDTACLAAVSFIRLYADN